MKERNEIRETLKDLKARGEEIRESMLPKSITPEMVGGTLSGLAEAMDQTLEGLRLSVYGFDKILEDVPDDKGNIKTSDPEGTIVFCGGAFSISRKGIYELMPEGAYNKAEGDKLTANGANLYMAGTEIYRVATGKDGALYLEIAFMRPDYAENQFEQLVEIVAASDPELDAETGKYYRFDEPVDSLMVKLPEMEEGNVVATFEVFLQTGGTPSVTFESAGSAEVEYFAGFSIEPNTTYELNLMWNGLKWIVAYAVVE